MAKYIEEYRNMARWAGIAARWAYGRHRRMVVAEMCSVQARREEALAMLQYMVAGAQYRSIYVVGMFIGAWKGGEARHSSSHGRNTCSI